jgi:hypothetical protein
LQIVFLLSARLAFLPLPSSLSNTNIMSNASANAKHQANKLHGAEQRAERHGEVLDTVLVPPAELGQGDQTPARNEAQRGSIRKHAACNLEEICESAARAENVLARDEQACNPERISDLIKQRHRNTKTARGGQEGRLRQAPSAAEHQTTGNGEFATVGLNFIAPGAAHHRPQRHERIPGLVAPLRPNEAEKITRRVGVCTCGCEQGAKCTCESCASGCHRDEELEDEAEAIAWRLGRNAPHRHR